MLRVPNTAEAEVLSFVRQHERDGRRPDGVFAAFNFSGAPQTVTLGEGPYAGAYADFATGEAVELAPGGALELPPWGYRVLVRP
jgi:hypothetical protein